MGGGVAGVVASDVCIRFSISRHQLTCFTLSLIATSESVDYADGLVGACIYVCVCVCVVVGIVVTRECNGLRGQISLNCILLNLDFNKYLIKTRIYSYIDFVHKYVCVYTENCI